MLYRLHFTDAGLAQMEALDLDRDVVRRAIDAGPKVQLYENHLLVRHGDLELEVRTLGADYEVLAVRRVEAWGARPAQLPYLRALESGDLA